MSLIIWNIHLYNLVFFFFFKCILYFYFVLLPIRLNCTHLQHMYLGTVRINFIRKLHHCWYLACFKYKAAVVWEGTRQASAGYDIFLTSMWETTSDSLVPKLAVTMEVKKRNTNNAELEVKPLHLNSSCAAHGDLLGTAKAHRSQINGPHKLRKNPD